MQVWGHLHPLLFDRFLTGFCWDLVSNILSGFSCEKYQVAFCFLSTGGLRYRRGPRPLHPKRNPRPLHPKRNPRPLHPKRNPRPLHPKRNPHPLRPYIAFTPIEILIASVLTRLCSSRPFGGSHEDDVGRQRGSGTRD